MGDIKNFIAARVAKELKDGDVVNLGIGLPTLVPNHLPEGVDLTLQSENGFVGLVPLEEGKGAMDLVVGARKVIVAMEHTNKGKHKILKECTLPLTAKGQVNLIVTEMGVMKVTPEGLALVEYNPEYTIEEIQAATEAELIIADDLKEMAV